jgi:hypothetical protein
MSHVYNDSVVYIRNGKPIPAIVLSSLMSDRGELLTVLYAQPEIGPTLLAQGTTRGIAQVQQAVAPFVEGNMFGWKDTEVETVTLANLPPSIAIYVKKLEDELAETTEGRDKALQEMADAGAVKRTAPEQLDEAQGPVEPGDPESPHAIEPESIKLAPEVPLVEGEPGSTSDNPLAG